MGTVKSHLGYCKVKLSQTKKVLPQKLCFLETKEEKQSKQNRDLFLEPKHAHFEGRHPVEHAQLKHIPFKAIVQEGLMVDTFQNKWSSR